MSICIHLSLHALVLSLTLSLSMYMYIIRTYRHKYTNLLCPRQNEVTNKKVVIHMYIYMSTCIRL